MRHTNGSIFRLTKLMKERRSKTNTTSQHLTNDNNFCDLSESSSNFSEDSPSEFSSDLSEESSSEYSSDFSEESSDSIIIISDTNEASNHSTRTLKRRRKGTSDNNNDIDISVDYESEDSYGSSLNEENSDKILKMIRDHRANNNAYTRLFAETGDKLERVCHYFSKGKICNKSYKFKNGGHLAKRASQQCQRHIKQHHKNSSIGHDNYQNYLNLKESPASQLLQEQSSKPDVTNFFSSKPKTNDDAFATLVSCFITAGVSYSFFDNILVRFALSIIWNGWKASYDRKSASQVIGDKARLFRESLKASINKQMGMILFRKFSDVSPHTFARKIFLMMYTFLAKHPIYVSLETDDWKANNGFSYSGIVCNIFSSVLKKHTFLLSYQMVDGKTKYDHKMRLLDVVSEYNIQKLWISTCTDNASNTIGSTSGLESAQYPLFSGHIGCLAHIINLISEELMKSMDNINSNLPNNLPAIVLSVI